MRKSFRNTGANEIINLINNSKQKNGRFIFRNRKVLGLVDFEKISKNEDYIDELTFENVHIKNGIRFGRGIKFGAIHFIECKVEDEIKLLGSDIQYLRFDEGFFESLVFYEGWIRRVVIDGGHFENCSFHPYNDQEIKSIDINYGLDGESNIWTTMNEFELGNRSCNSLNCFNLNTKKMIIKDDFLGESYKFKNIKVDSLSFENFRKAEKSSFSINNLLANISTGTGVLEVYQSSLSGVEFYNSELEFNTNKFYDSEISEVKTINSKWPKKIYGYDFKKKNKIESKPPIEKEAYKQFRLMFAKSGDKIEELNYYAKEIETYRRALSWKSDWEKKLIFWFNKISNNHGLNWIQPLLLIFGITYLVYFYLVYSYDVAHIGSYWDFILPTHKLAKAEFIADKHLALDFLTKVAVGYLIYQMIRAFRRYAMK